jgi:SAM-dependent methyltransferase
MMAGQDKAAKYITPRKRMIEIRSPRLFFWGKRIELVLGLLKKLRKGQEIRRHFGVSHSAYQAYEDWEMRAYEQGSTWTYDHGRMARVPFVRIRDYYLAPVIAEIELLHQSDPSRPVEVLEVGCGNGTNLMVLRKALGEKVRLSGIDISAERLRLGRDYWGDRLDGVEMVEDSATTLATQADGSADLVYSVHCLEQIPYAVDDCLSSIARVTRHNAVFVEPTWEYANRAQKMYTLFGDQLRTLLPSLAQSGLEIVRQDKAELLANPLNQNGFIIAAKR